MSHPRIPHTSHWGSFDAVVDDGRLVRVDPFAGDRDPSPLIHAVPDIVHHRSRVRRPTVRRHWLEYGPEGDRGRRGADEWVEIAWDEALDVVAAELRRVIDRHGNEAIFGGSYGWGSAGRFHHASTQLKRFLNCLGGFTDKQGTYSCAAALVLLPHIVGTVEPVMGPLSTWDGIARDCELMVCFGGVPLRNTQIHAGGVGDHAAPWWVNEAAGAGVRFISIGPVRHEAVEELAAEWISIRPNTDVALMLGLAHVLLTENRHDEAFLARYCAGFDRCRGYVLGEQDGIAKDPRWAAAICGVPSDRIRLLARDMAEHRTMLSSTWSLQRADHGEQPYWMTVLLAAMLGQIGLPGGGFGFGYFDESGYGVPRRRLPSPTLPVGRNPTGSFIPVARIADMLLDPGGHYEFDGQTRVYPTTRLIYWCGGNPFHHHQDLGRLTRAFQQPETIIVHEPFWTATARHADIVLPATTTLERNDIGASSGDRFLLAMHQALPPQGEARDDFEIFADLAERLGAAAAFTGSRDSWQWLTVLYDEWASNARAAGVDVPLFDDFWQSGHVEVPADREPYVMFSAFRADPDAHALPTPSGRIELFSSTIDAFGYDDCPGHPVWLEPAEWLGATEQRRHPLHLLSPQPATRLHSQLDQGRVSAASKVQDREPLWIHPEDAARRGIADGSLVRVFNDRGHLLAGAVLTDRIMRGVVQLATGAWYDPSTDAAGRTLDRHGNPNVLTMDKGSSRLAQAPAANTSLVEAEPYLGPPPPVAAFDSPMDSTV